MKDLIIEQKPTHAARPRSWTGGLMKTYQTHDHNEGFSHSQNLIKRYGDSRWRDSVFSIVCCRAILCRQSILVAAQSIVGFIVQWLADRRLPCVWLLQKARPASVTTELMRSNGGRYGTVEGSASGWEKDPDDRTYLLSKDSTNEVGDRRCTSLMCPTRSLSVVLTLSHLCDHKLPCMSSVRRRPKVGQHSSGIH